MSVSYLLWLDEAELEGPSPRADLPALCPRVLAWEDVACDDGVERVLSTLRFFACLVSAVSQA